MLRKITWDRCYHFENRENEKHDLVRREAPATLWASDLRHSRCPASAPSPVRRRTAGRKWGAGPDRPRQEEAGTAGWGAAETVELWAGAGPQLGIANVVITGAERASGLPEQPLLSPRTPLSPTRRTRPRRGLQGLTRPAEPDESLPWVENK